ncbi:hypothetical protein ONZ45_g1322 [Pleurotus djamor]|nr:hypothetical protein ONZ45_g1322 [Pleurotus djamor]
MLRCRELRKLPKPSGLTSISFRGQTPGSPETLLNPRTQPSKTPKDQLLAPKHPSVQLQKREFPSFSNPAFSINAYPFAVLDRPIDASKRPISLQLKSTASWKDSFEDLGTELNAKRYANEADMAVVKVGTRVPMSMLVATSKKNTSKKATIRNELKRRIKTALNLVVARGATAKPDSTGQLQLVLPENAPEQNNIVLQGWSYIFRPTLEVYRMPYPTLVKHLRDALEGIWKAGIAKEKAWSVTLANKKRSTQKVVQKDALKVDAPKEVNLPKAPEPQLSVPPSPEPQVDFDPNKWAWHGQSPSEPIGHDNPSNPNLFADEPLPEIRLSPLFEKIKQRLATHSDVARTHKTFELEPLIRAEPRPKLFFNNKPGRPNKEKRPMGHPMGSFLQSAEQGTSPTPFDADITDTNSPAKHLFRRKSLVLKPASLHRH